MTDLSEINPCSLLEDFKSVNTENKISAIKNINTIILCLGKLRTIEEFIPFLMEFSDEEDDIVIIELNNQLKVILEYIGIQSYKSVLELWEKIALMEEMTIKKSSIISFEEIFNMILNFNSTNFVKNFEEEIILKLEFFYECKEYFFLLNIIKIVFIKLENPRKRLIK